MRNNQPVTDEQRYLDPKRPVVTKTDLKGKILYANPSFVEISGFSEAELIGQPHNVVRHPTMPPQAFADLWATVKSNRPWQGLVKNRCKDGAFYWVDAYVTPVTKQGEVVGFMSVRSAPSKEQIDGAKNLYERVNQGTAAFPATPSPPRFRFSWVLGLAISVPALLSWGAVILGLPHWLTFFALAVLCAGATFLCNTFARTPLIRAQHAIRSMGEGNLRERIETQALNEFNALLTDLESMRVNLRAIIADAVSAANDVDQQSLSISEQAEQLSTRTHAQSDGIASVAAALEQLSVAVNEISEATQRSTVHADSARAVSIQGGREMEEVRRASDHIGTLVDEAHGVIEAQSEAIRRIGTVTQAIKEIADQTNLLALNAAIEAARAGEQGRGFAVVADEVRKLAERTSGSTETITVNIATVQERTASVLTSMRAVTDAVGEGRVRINKTLESLREIEQATEGVAQSSRDVATVLSQQSQASSDVAVSMERMAALTEENDSSTARIASSVVRLADIIRALHTTLNHFEQSL